MGESNTVVSAYTMYRHLQQYCSHPLRETREIFTGEKYFRLFGKALAKSLVFISRWKVNSMLVCVLKQFFVEQKYDNLS